MSFNDVIKQSVLDGFSTGVSTAQTLVILGVTFALSIYIFVIYKLTNRTSFYDKRFHVSVSIISMITAGIIIAMQSSIVISLGMVGALSIVRFRTAVKDALDLVFLFWSIGVGIICGAGLFELAIEVSLMVTIGVFAMEYLPLNKKPYLLIVNCDNGEVEDAMLNAIKGASNKYSIKSRNIKKSGADFILEVNTKTEKELLKALNEVKGVNNISLLTNEGEVRV